MKQLLLVGPPSLLSPLKLEQQKAGTALYFAQNIFPLWKVGDEREHRTLWGPQPESLAALNAWGAGKGGI